MMAMVVILTSKMRSAALAVTDDRGQTARTVVNRPPRQLTRVSRT